MNAPTSIFVISLQQRDRTSSLRSMIEDTLKDHHPATVGQLARSLATLAPFDEEGYVAEIKSMAREGSLKLSRPSYEIFSALDYLLTPTISGWFWGTFFLTSLAMAAVDFIPSSIPLSIIRWVFGAALLISPGYATIKLLFPYSDMPRHQVLALSIPVSLAVVPIIGFILNFTPWGIKFTPVIVSLGAFTIFTSVAAASRNYLAVVEREE